MKSDTGRETVLGVERNDKELKIRIGGQPVDSARALVEALPILLVHPESHRLVAEGPAHRRQFLDWGVFHVEPTFHAIWNRYRKALNQRNAVLKQGLSVGQLGPWEKEMEEAATALDLLRKKYMEELGPHFLRLGSELLEGQEVLLHYRRGWPESVKLSVVLQETREGDRKLGYTRYGPHRADLTLLLGRDRAVTVASRGQQKLLLLSLILAQAELLSQRRSQKRPILLIDDLPSELDASRLNKVLKVLDSLQYQTFVTGTERSMFPPEIVECSRTFHVEHGRIEPMV
ncbi:MAG: DNA replication/repair protein RecF [Gammaproteobacteria bacterium]